MGYWPSDPTVKADATFLFAMLSYFRDYKVHLKSLKSGSFLEFLGMFMTNVTSKKKEKNVSGEKWRF